ncbi:MAG: oxygen-dependent coproporphyrinogen oxidase [Gammaproteobacteria bacterium AqS3]|nr:oxygen-dependent coproporphyrinogen oxidase [Gammaproteobacteria bacterium AqS3]
MNRHQDDLCRDLAALGGAGDAFEPDPWRSDLGVGETRQLIGGAALERAAVNRSDVAGDALPGAATEHRPELHGAAFRATGLSVVVHPRNPHAPAAHLNVRLITAGARWWFGGGFDLTPCYGYVEDCVDWHRTARQCCGVLGDADTFYGSFKRACDEYFHLPHRREARGIGGIFFDDLALDGDFPRCQDFALGVAAGFARAYLPILGRRIGSDYGEAERAFQLHRRGRYVEFNLVHDRGTRFGLQSGGRIESILASLPPEVRWGGGDRSEEERLLRDFLAPRDWLAQEVRSGGAAP